LESTFGQRLHLASIGGTRRAGKSQCVPGLSPYRIRRLDLVGWPTDVIVSAPNGEGAVEHGGDACSPCFGFAW
jgi:hypothetical protein